MWQLWIWGRTVARDAKEQKLANLAALAHKKDASSRKVRHLEDCIAKLTGVNGSHVVVELDADLAKYHGYTIRERLRCFSRGKLSASVLKVANGHPLSNESTATELAPTIYQVVLELENDFFCSIAQSLFIGDAYLAFRKNPM